MALKTEQEISRESLSRATVLSAAAVICTWGAIQAREFLIPLILSVLLALTMAPVVRLFKRLRFPEWAAVAVTALLLYLPLLGLASLMLIEAENLVKNWPSIYDSARGSLERLAHSSILESSGISGYLDISDLQAAISARAGEGALVLFNGLRTVLSAGTLTFLVFTFAVIMLASRRHVRVSLDSILAADDSPQRSRMLDETAGVLEGFLLARVSIIAFVALADYVILKLFGVGYAVTLGALLGLSTLVPVIGFFAGIIPPLILSASAGKDPLFLVTLALSLGAVSFAQDHFLAPKLIGRRLNLGFLPTYIAIFAGERMWGIWGMFLSIPILGLVHVLLTHSRDLKPWARLLEH